MRNKQVAQALEEISRRLAELEHAAELMRTVLIVKEPQTVHAANAYDGLRKQVVAAMTERRAHLGQLASMAVAVERAADVADLRPQVQEWLRHAGVVPLRSVPSGQRAQDLFEDVDGGTLEGVAFLEVLEPAYVDTQAGLVLRLGRARAGLPADEPPSGAASEAGAAGTGAPVPSQPDPQPVLQDDVEEEARA